MGAYEITLGDLTPFENPLALRFHYDLEEVKDGLEPQDHFFVAYLHEETGRWVEAGFSLDKANHEIIVLTNHLSLWSLFGLSDDTVMTYSPHFKIYFKDSLNAPMLRSDPSDDGL